MVKGQEKDSFETGIDFNAGVFPLTRSSKQLPNLKNREILAPSGADALF